MKIIEKQKPNCDGTVWSRLPIGLARIGFPKSIERWPALEAYDWSCSNVRIRLWNLRPTKPSCAIKTLLSEEVFFRVSLLEDRTRRKGTSGNCSFDFNDKRIRHDEPSTAVEHPKVWPQYFVTWNEVHLVGQSVASKSSSLKKPFPRFVWPKAVQIISRPFEKGFTSAGPPPKRENEAYNQSFSPNSFRRGAEREINLI